MREPQSPYGASDAARRLSDAINLHVAALPMSEIFRGRWIAVRLADGHNNGRAYDSRYGAVLDHHNLAMPYAYPQIPPDGCTPRVAETLLSMWRRAYDNGLRLAPDDVAGGLILVTPNGRLM